MTKGTRTPLRHLTSAMPSREANEANINFGKIGATRKVVFV